MPDALVTEHELIEDFARFSRKPYEFVLYSFPWTEPGELEKFAGPEPWQRDILIDLGQGLLTIEGAIRLAVASGHGIGKSSIVAWIMLWAMATHEDTRGVVTANTETQLVTKTWVELAKWYRLFIGRSLFKLTATALFSADPEHERTWRIDMVPWSERNTEAFAGLHNQGKRIVLIFDEASAIPDVIWSTAEGAMTDRGTEIIWAVFGNPTRNTGRFHACFHEYQHRWRCRQVDSREVSLSNKKQIAEWIEDYGEDSDFVRVRVRGEFPRQGAMEFISHALVKEAQTRPVAGLHFEPLILGVDIARYGDDATVLYYRHGTDARTIDPIIIRMMDLMSIAARIAQEYTTRRPDAIFIDAGGYGAGVIDRCRQLRIPVWPVDFGGKADGVTDFDERIGFLNKRAEMWGAMRRWLKTGGIPALRELETQLIAPLYFFSNKNLIQLEGKREMKARGEASPDIADALALTFAYPVGQKAITLGRKTQHQYEYDPFAEVWQTPKGGFGGHI